MLVCSRKSPSCCLAFGACFLLTLFGLLFRKSIAHSPLARSPTPSRTSIPATTDLQGGFLVTSALSVDTRILNKLVPTHAPNLSQMLNRA